MCAFAILFTALAAAQIPSTAGLDSYHKAMAVLDAGITAMGGREALQGVKSVRRQLEGEWIGSGQHPRPVPVVAPTLQAPPANARDRHSILLDLAGNRWLDEAIEADLKGDFGTRRTVVTESGGFETVTYRDERPFYREFSRDDALSLHLRRLRRYPETLLRMALDRPETLAWVGAGWEFGREQQVISFADPAGTRVLLYFDTGTHLLAKSEFLREHAIAGDSFADVVYEEYRPVGALQLPFRYIERVAGVPTEVMRADAIELDVSIPEDRFRAPERQNVVRMASDPSEPVVEKLGDGLYMIRGPYNIVFAGFRDHVVVLEAPVSSRYTEACLGLIRATVPDKPIRYLVSTHFHYDHVAGVRPYVAEGVSILTTPDAKAIIQQVASSRRTMYPDALSRKPQAPKIETIAGSKILDDGANRVELYDVGPSDHIAQMLVAYFPKEKLLFEADVWDPTSLELPLGWTDTTILARKIEELGLQVDRIIPVHGIPATMEAMRRGVAIRAKYGR